MTEPVNTRPDLWIAHVFSSHAVDKGGVIRRSVAWVEKEVGRDRFVTEVRARGFHLFEAGGQFVVVCTRAPIRRIL